MRIFIRNLFIIWVLAAQSPVCAEEISSAFMSESEDMEVAYVDKKTGEERSRWHISLEKTPGNKTALYKTSSTGKGAYDIYQDVAWEAGSEMEEKKALSIPCIASLS